MKGVSNGVSDDLRHTLESAGLDPGQAETVAPLIAAVQEVVRQELKAARRDNWGPYDRFTPEEAYEALRISRSTFYRLVKANEIRVYYDAGVPFVPRWELDRYKRETAEQRPGPISNEAAKRHDARRKAGLK